MEAKCRTIIESLNPKRDNTTTTEEILRKSIDTTRMKANLPEADHGMRQAWISWAAIVLSVLAVPANHDVFIHMIKLPE